ncbi:MAG: hypothetical protein QME16_00105 [Planctomycetota bacterium]|nr:hypothetical protein [Planctomycetota bacterium]
MFRFFKGLFFGIILATCFSLYADKISAPPPLSGEPIAEQLYLQELYTNFHRLEVVETNPDGSRSGKKGDQLQLQTGGNVYHCENSDSSTTWRCSQLTDIP